MKTFLKISAQLAAILLAGVTVGVAFGLDGATAADLTCAAQVAWLGWKIAG